MKITALSIIVIALMIHAILSGLAIMQGMRFHYLPKGGRILVWIYAGITATLGILIVWLYLSA